MSYRIQYDCSNIPWEQVAETLISVGIASYDPMIHKKAFENSHIVIFVFDGNRMIGFGRALSDDAYQTSPYDIAVIPDYQGKGVGELIFEITFKGIRFQRSSLMKERYPIWTVLFN